MRKMPHAEVTKGAKDGVEFSNPVLEKNRA